LFIGSRILPSASAVDEARLPRRAPAAVGMAGYEAGPLGGDKVLHEPHARLGVAAEAGGEGVEGVHVERLGPQRLHQRVARMHTVARAGSFTPSCLLADGSTRPAFPIPPRRVEALLAQT